MDRSPKKPPPPPPASTGPKSANDWRGKLLANRYQIGSQLGAGGFGIVYRAWDRRRRVAVAVKVLREEFGARPALRRRFAREAKALLTLAHPHVITITDCGLADGMPFFAMELLEGYPLEVELKTKGAMAAERALALIQQLLAGLSYVHTQGLVHRDLKPGNIFLQRRPDGEERVKLLDFGLAKFTQPVDVAEGASLTGGGEVVGTPAYMPPEQLASQQGDARADVYSAAVVLFQMLSGRRPFEGEPYDVLRMVLVDPAPSLSSLCPGRGVIPELDALFERALQKDPAERYQGADEFAAALADLPSPSQWLQPSSVEAGSKPAVHVEPAPPPLVPMDTMMSAPAIDRPSPPESGSSGYSLESVAGSLWFMRYGLRALRLLLAAGLGAAAMVLLISPELGDRLRLRFGDDEVARRFWAQRAVGSDVESHYASAVRTGGADVDEGAAPAIVGCDRDSGVCPPHGLDGGAEPLAVATGTVAAATPTAGVANGLVAPPPPLQLADEVADRDGATTARAADVQVVGSAVETTGTAAPERVAPRRAAEPLGGTRAAELKGRAAPHYARSRGG